jgi:hypothetical protein
MEEIRVTSWNDLQDKLFADSWQPEIYRYRSPFAFRGISHTPDGLKTSLARLGGDYAAMEPHLLRNFIKYARRSIQGSEDSVWYWLSLAKHYGLPTRLLDWSFSPFVALHFATDNIALFDRDSEIWMVNFHRVHKLLPEKLRALLKEEGSDVFTVEMLASVARSVKELQKLSHDDFALFFEPPSIDERITNQYALFSSMSSPTARMEIWLGEHPEAAQKIILPATLKWEVRDKLDQANITERVLFPGLDGLSRWLARQYTPRSDLGE